MPDFVEVFGFPRSVLARAPGRVNLLGEHTDYNDGFVLPTVIPQETVVEIGPSPCGRFRYYSENLGELVELEVEQRATAGFARYVHGCVEVLRTRGIYVPPCSLRINTTVPIGSGLSSSAALEVATIRCLQSLLGLTLDDLEIALLAHQAEVEFAGVHCGILDQVAVSLGRPEQMLFLDTRTLERRHVPLPSGSSMLIIDSGVRRNLAGTDYNLRRRECQMAAARLGVPALRDVTDVGACAHLPAPLDRRARHVITENRRALDGAEIGDGRAFGRLMNASHASLRDDFEVSVPALDRLVARLQQCPEVHGARLTGAGFGGACIALVETGAAEAVSARVLRAFAGDGYCGTRLV